MAGLNAKEVLNNINDCIEELEAQQGRWLYDPRYVRRGYGTKYNFKIRAVCRELSIFDWWNDGLSLSQLKQMRSFVQTAIKLGFTGYVCFKVGAAGCSHGMWAHKEESKDGYSPDGDCLFHSFRSGDNHWDICLNGSWKGEYTAKKCGLTMAEVKEALA